MNRREMLIRETEGLTASDLREVLDFVRFLKTKSLKKRSETLCLANPVCGKIGSGRRKMKRGKICKR